MPTYCLERVGCFDIPYFKSVPRVCLAGLALYIVETVFYKLPCDHINRTCQNGCSSYWTNVSVMLKSFRHCFMKRTNQLKMFFCESLPRVLFRH